MSFKLISTLVNTTAVSIQWDENGRKSGMTNALLNFSFPQQAPSFRAAPFDKKLHFILDFCLLQFTSPDNAYSALQFYDFHSINSFPI